MKSINHPFHLVNISPRPFTNYLTLMTLMLGMLKWIHTGNANLLTISLSSLKLTSTLWWRDIVSSFQGSHNKQVSSSLQLRMTMFIISEIFFFISFFWWFFHSSLSPTHEVGLTCPPEGLKPISPSGLPLLNTATLIYSEVMITLSHYNLILNEMLKSHSISIISFY